jgi:hypothetical protein
MITKIFDTISKAIEKLRPSFALFFVTLLILHFSINLYQNEFTEIMDNLSVNLFGNAKVLELIDVIAFNCFFFFSLLSILTYRLCFDSYNDENQPDYYYTLRKAYHETRGVCKISFIIFYFVHILLNYKLYITDFLLTLLSFFTSFHFSGIAYTLIICLLSIFFRKLHDKLSNPL